MPHPELEPTEPVTDSETRSVAWATLYSEVLDTGTDHVGVAVRDEATLADHLDTAEEFVG